MKTALIAIALAAFSASAFANDYTEEKSFPNAIHGTMTIDFKTRTETNPDGTPAPEAKDVYTTDISIVDSISLRGKIVRQPWLPTSTLGATKQDGFLAYDLKCVLQNPKNPTQTLTLGSWIGAMSLDGNGKYSLGVSPEERGRLRIATDSVGKITGFTSNYAGEIQGRIPEQAGLWGFASRASAKVNKTYTRYVNGKALTHTVAGADPMGFRSVDLAQGPLAGYPQSHLNGSVDYDAETGIWYVDVTTNYLSDGQAVNDRYSGTIRWNEDPNRKLNGIGWYDVNVRVNEKANAESDAFPTPGVTAEDEFFAADTAVPGFTGKIAYVDTFNGDSVTASKVNYAIDGNKVSKIQSMNFAKVLLLIVGPFNDE